MAKARKRKGRAVHGILLLDKPKGLSSNQALQRVKWLMKAQKAGHTGNLDPMATGMLPLCFGNATRVSAFLLDADKHYSAEVKLGQRTDTGDAEGVVVEEAAVPSLTEADLANARGGDDDDDDDGKRGATLRERRKEISKNIKNACNIS